MKFFSFFGKIESADFSPRLLTASCEKISQISLAKLEPQKILLPLNEMQLPYPNGGHGS